MGALRGGSGVFCLHFRNFKSSVAHLVTIWTASLASDDIRSVFLLYTHLPLPLARIAAVSAHSSLAPSSACDPICDWRAPPPHSSVPLPDDEPPPWTPYVTSSMLHTIAPDADTPMSQVQPLRINKNTTPASSPAKMLGQATSRPLAEIGSTERRRNSPSYNQATKVHSQLILSPSPLLDC